jgi:hypothetical protein
LLVGRSMCVSLCAALRKPAIPAVAIQLLEASCVAAPLSLPVWQQLFDWGHLNMHGTRIWASVWETIPSVPKPYNLETAPPSLWLLCVLPFHTRHQLQAYLPSGILPISLAPISGEVYLFWNVRCNNAAYALVRRYGVLSQRSRCSTRGRGATSVYSTGQLMHVLSGAALVSSSTNFDYFFCRFF